MTSTLLDIVNETQLVLAGYTQKQDQATALVGNMLATDYSFVTSGTVQLSRGLVEIDDELIWVDSFDKTTNTAIIAPYGRGFRGTTAASHTAGSRVTLAPTFPRSAIERNINATIDGLYPDLFGTASTTFIFSAARTTYPLPIDCIDVINVSWQSIGPSREWIPVKDYRIDLMADPTTWTTGKTISVYSGIVPGRTVTIRYTNKPPTLVNTTDVFETVTGLPASCREVVVLGAAYRMAVYLDLARIPATAPEAAALGQSNPIGSATNLSRVLKQMYSDRLLVEVRRQQAQFKPRVHHTK
jgi:hypothetical protein